VTVFEFMLQLPKEVVQVEVEITDISAGNWMTA
jgi:hypothetical protein